MPPLETHSELKLRDLRYFIYIADFGSINRAAKYIGLAQPALSARMRQLEKALGITLIVRDSRGCSLTPHGKRLYSLARELLEDVADIVDQLRLEALPPQRPASESPRRAR